jgi:outer membrane protein assembly factor BamB
MHRTRQVARIGLAWAMITGASAATAEDWPAARGPRHDGTSLERGLPERWSPAGQGLLWRVPFGARSAPVVHGRRVYVQGPVGSGATAQERVACLDADTGRLLWEQRFNVFHSDVPAHRVGWASPTVDPRTGHVYVFGVDAHLQAFSAEGRRLWERSLTEEFGAITTHGGRTVTPLIEGDLVIVSTLTAGWGDQARGANRFFAFDKQSGANVWVSAPQPRHYDTNYATAVPATVGGRRLLIVGGTDGALHALEATTGRPIWHYDMSKRAINTSVIVRGERVYTTHSEENFDTSEMGQIAALDATASGALEARHVAWRTHGFQGGFSSPVADDERLYVVDNGAVLAAFDLASGRKLWDKNLGTIQKAGLVLADGKLYVGTENGRFYILRPRADGVDVLDDDALGNAAQPEPVLGSVAVAHGRIYLPTMDALYCIGPRGRRSPDAQATTAAPAAVGSGPPSYVQVRPAELLLAPGARARFEPRLFDSLGRPLPVPEGATWSVEGLSGTVGPQGDLSLAAEAPLQGGLVKVSFGALTGSARVRVVPPLPARFDFEGTSGPAPPAAWINATGKFQLRDREGGRALAKLADTPLTKRGRLFFGASTLSDYTVQADVLATEKRRQMGDGGLIAQRYALVLFGNSQQLELQPWQANAARTLSVPYAWQPETWQRLKLRVQNLADGRTRVQAKAWPAAAAEPETWLIERVDDLPHRQGSPGLYADAPAEVFFDNIVIAPNTAAQGAR